MQVTSDSIRVLHVEDDPAFAELAATVLEREDDRIDVISATTVDEAFDHLEEHDVDCVVSDYDMSRLNGIELLESIRVRFGDVPFILFTGKGSEEIASEAISAGVTDYLQKRGGTDQYTLLANRIRNAVEGSRSRQALEERNRRLETLISNVPGMVYRCRNAPEWPMEFVSGECEALCGYTAAELEGDDVLWGEEILHPEDREEMWDRVQEAIEAREPFEVSYRIVTKGGEVRWMWERGQGLYADGELTAIEGFITDITARRERELEVERTNAVLSTLFDALPVGVLAEDTDRTIMAVNQRLIDMLGLSCTPDQVIGTDCEAATRKAADRFAEPAAFVDRTEELVASQRPVQDERLELADGRTFERSYRPIELPDGEGHFRLYRDITERIDRTEDLERYESIVTASGDPVYTLDADGMLTSVNEALLEMTGYDEEALLGEHVSAIVPPDDVEEGRRLIRSLLSSSKDRGIYELYLVTADGERISCEAHVALLPFEESFRGTVGVIRDITERKRRERKLEALGVRTAELLRAATTAETAQAAADTAHEVLGFPLSGFYLDREDASLDLVATAGDLDADHPGDLDDDHPDDPDADRDSDAPDTAWPDAVESASPPAVVREAAARGEPLVLDGTGRVMALDDDQEGQRLVAYPIDTHGVFVISPATADGFDETQRAMVDILLSSLTAALDRTERERLLRERERELHHQNERLDDFASVVSHDLRNPLNVASGHLELARMECDSEHLDAVEGAHDRMEALIGDLLTLARYGETATEIESVPLAAMLDRCWSNVETGDATLLVRTDRVIRADGSRLQQLLENLIGNAVEHGDEAVTITVGDLPDGFYVEDDGPGIPPDKRDQVFETGFSTSDSGTGFGLSIVKQIADAHGWTLTVTDGTDGGARFEFTGVDVDA